MYASIIVNFATAVILLVVGLLVMFSIIPSGNMNTTTYYLFAFILIGYGIYRFINTFSKIKQHKLQERIEKIEEEREKLLGK